MLALTEEQDDEGVSGTQVAKALGSTFGAGSLSSLLPRDVIRVPVDWMDHNPQIQLGLNEREDTPVRSDPPRFYPTNGFGIFGFGSFSLQEEDETDREASSDTDRFGGAIGVDYRQERFIVGIAFDYFRENTEFDDAKFTLADTNGDTVFTDLGGDIDVDEFGVGLFGLYDLWEGERQRVSLLGAARFAYNEYDVERDVVGLDDVNAFVQEGKVAADTDGFEYSFLTGLTYDATPTPWLLVGGSALLELTRTEVDGYEEEVTEGSQALEVGAFEFDDENVDTLTSILELRIGTEVPTNYATLVPIAFARYFHEFENDSQEIEAAVVDPFGQLLDGTAVFRTNNPDRNYFAVGAGLQLFMMGNLSTQLGYDILLGHEFREEQNIGLTIRWGF